MRRFALASIVVVLLGGAGYPAKPQMDRVRDFLDERGGVAGVAVIDSNGRVRSTHGRRRFVSASLVKAMLLVSYLRKVNAEDRGLSRSERSRLARMIKVSSNRAASWAYQRVGDDRLRRLAKRADMHQFGIHGWWTNAYTSARDQARFFWGLRALTPKRFRAYALDLLRSVHRSQSWGIPRVARRRGFSVFFKGGWRPTSLGRLVHQTGFVRRGRVRFSLAVLTDANPSFSHGVGTIQGVTRRIVNGAPRR